MNVYLFSILYPPRFIQKFLILLTGSKDIFARWNVDLSNLNPKKCIFNLKIVVNFKSS